MDFIRRRVKGAALLALCALALQFALAFGHVHHDGLLAGEIAAVAPQTQPQGDNDAAAPCDICATVQLIGTSLTPDAPVLALPVAFATAPLLTLNAPSFIPNAPNRFRARGPPQA